MPRRHHRRLPAPLHLPWAQTARRYAEHYGAGGTSRVLGGSAIRVSAPLATLANGVAAHAFELNRLRKPGSALVPVALGEELHSSGAEVLTAIIASEELGFHAPGLTGPFGAAIVAGKLLRLDADRLADAASVIRPTRREVAAVRGIFAHAELLLGQLESIGHLSNVAALPLAKACPVTSRSVRA